MLSYPLTTRYISFTRTTGVPKCICHSAGGALLQQKKEFIFQYDMGLESAYYQYTTTGWMMWNYLIGALSVGARIVLFDGNPLYPTPMHQVRILEEQGVTHWGTSPKFLTALKQCGGVDDAAMMPELPSLKFTIAAGAPLSDDISKWFSSRFSPDVGLFSGSGGTDLVGGIVGGTPLSVIHHGELAAASLGMAVEIWDSRGRNIDASGEKGDLIITKPFFSMPLTFWGPNGHEKYRKAYFSAFPGVWCHGDFIRKNPVTGGYVILGRSDGVLNPGGVRFGSAELYSVLDRFAQIQDCIVVGQRREQDADEQVLMFVKMQQPGAVLDDRLKSDIRLAIKSQLSARHVPAHILQVADIPYTMNGKKIETTVRDVVNGGSPRDTGVTANPECLEEYRQYAKLPPVVPMPKL